MSFPYKNPISPNQLLGQQSLERTKTFGTSYSTLSTGGYMEVYSLDQLYYTIPPSTFGPIEFSGNSIPITFSKGSGTTFSYDTLTLQPDNISSGRRKQGMLVYVKEVDQVYQYSINNYETLWNNATGSTGTTIISDFGTTIRANSPENITFINSWTANTIDGVGGVTRANAVWKKYHGTNLAITGGSYNSITNTLTLTNITGGTQNITGFGGGGGGGATITGGTFDKNTETLTLSSSGGSIFITGFTDVYTTGGTFDNGAKSLELYDNSGNTITITGFTSVTGLTGAGAYGSFSDTTNQPVSGANIETVWTYNTTEISNGIYISGGSKIRVSQYGIYSIGYSGQIEKTQGGTATDVTIWAKINGNNVDRSSSTTTLVSNSAYILPFVSYIFELYPNDYLEFYFSAPSQYVQLTTLSGLTSPTRPDSPSVIIVAQSVLGTTATFTGNTSATCITDLYVENLYGCSPINVNDLLIGNSGITTSSLTGTTIRNNFIVDSGNTITIKNSNRQLMDTSGVVSVDWSNRTINDSGNNISIDWENRKAKDTLGNNSIDWESKGLIDSTNTNSVGWDSRRAYDSLGGTSLDWESKDLYDSSSVISLNYNSRTLTDSGSNILLDWQNGIADLSSLYSTNISANTISATTYQNLPTEVFVTGATYSNNTITFTNNTGGTFNVLFNTFTGATINGNLSVTGSTSSSSFSGSSDTITGSKGSVITSGSSTTAFINVSGSNTVGGTGYTDFIRVTNTAAGATNINKTIRVNNNGRLEFLNSAYTFQTLNLSDNGILSVGGDNFAGTSSSDGVSNYLQFGNNTSQIYDDGNFHIHSRSAGQSMWINTNGGQLNLLTQAPLAGASIGSGIAIATTSLNGYVTINTGRTVTTAAAYGFLTTAGAGTYPGGSQSISISLYANNRIWGQEIDAFSDERMKDIQGEITLEEGVKLVNNLTPIKYTWKEGDDKGIKAGYSAQQVSKAGFDHLISLIPKEGLEETIDEDGFLSPKDTQFSMNYDQVVPYHGVVIKHLLEEIENLKKEIESLKNK
jgi:hypothetical protein